MGEIAAFVKQFNVDSFHVRQEGDGKYEMLCWEDDPLKIVEKLKMEISVLKSQLRTAMEMYYAVEDKAKGRNTNVRNVCAGKAGGVSSSEGNEERNLFAEEKS